MLLAFLDEYIIPFLVALYSSIGYGGVFIAMAIESACIPLPSEIVLPMAGWMVADGRFEFWPTVIAGTLGCTFGSAVAYWVGALGGRPLLLRYGKYILISTHDIDIADRWFTKYGEAAIFFSRLLPVVRTFISFPAGVSRMHFVRFLIYSTLGSLPWSFALVYAGKLLGDNWELVKAKLHNLDYVIVAVILALVAFYVYRHLSNRSTSKVS